MVPVPSLTATNAARELNGLLSRPSPAEAALLSMNQIMSATGSVTVAVELPWALDSVYVKVSLPLNPAGGS